MQPITLNVVVDEKRRIMIDLPDDVPTGLVKITVEPLAESGELQPGTREWLRARLIAAGPLSNAHRSPDAVYVSEAERERLAQVFEGLPPLSETIGEDREERL